MYNISTAIDFTKIFKTDNKYFKELNILQYGKSTFNELYNSPSSYKVQANNKCLDAINKYCKDLNLTLDKLSYCGNTCTFSIRCLLSNGNIVIFTHLNNYLVKKQ